MAQIFHPSFNPLSRFSILLAAVLVIGVLSLLGAINRSDYATQVKVVRPQPVPFSHKHHVQGLGIDCRYCHWQVEDAAFAGIPSTEVCMGCHQQIWSRSPLLEPVRESYRTGRPLQWTRVHDLPDHVYFDHGVHVAGGIGCSTCHGRVDEMPLTWKVETLQMEWCLACHREPDPYRRPRKEVFNAAWTPSAGRGGETERIQGPSSHLDQLLNCSTCHR